MKLKSVMVTIEEEGKPDSNHLIPFDVFAWHFSKDVQSNWGNWSESYIKVLKSWEPNKPWNLPQLSNSIQDEDEDYDILGGP